MRRIGAGGGEGARLKSHVQSAAAAFMVVCSFAVAGPAGALTRGQVTAELSNIAYLQGSEYFVEITVLNRSAAPVDPAEPGLRFSVQSEVLGQWIELSWRTKSGRAYGDTSVLSPGEERKKAVIVTLPVSLPHLYRNHEGDVNMRFQYQFACSGGNGPPEQDCAGESAYWVTPGTDRWVLREGM